MTFTLYFVAPFDSSVTNVIALKLWSVILYANWN